MPRQILKRILPQHHEVAHHWALRPFRALLTDPALLSLNRRSVAKAVAIGLFWAFMPVPLQGVFAVLMALWFRVNVLVPIACVWISNPLTLGPFVYLAYKLGALILGPSPEPFHFELSFAWLSDGFKRTWAPFLLGSFLLGLGSAALGYFSINYVWQYALLRRYEHRQRTRSERRS